MRDSDDRVEREEPDALESKSLSRRDFLRIVGAAGAALGLGAGLGGLMAACAGAEETTTSSSEISTTTVTGSTTTVSTMPENGRDIILGLVSPKTGPLASFALADDWWIDFAMAAVPGGILGGDGMQHRIVIRRADSQSVTSHAFEAASDLINNNKVDLMMASGSVDTVNPVAEQCEALGCPSIANLVPWELFVFGRKGALGKSFKWTYCHGIGLEDIAGNFVEMWEQVSTSKKVGFLFADDSEGVAWTDMSTGLPPAAKAAGYQYSLPDLYPVGTEDFTKYISDFSKNGCEICCGNISTADFANFWKQSLKQKYRPMVLSVGKALLFPQTLDALGFTVHNATTEALWHPTWPYTDSITGKTCQELADDYTFETGAEWTVAIGQYAKFEWAVDVFKRVTNIDDKENIIEAIRTTKLDTCLGPIDFLLPVDMTDTLPIKLSDLSLSSRPTENVYKAPCGGVQWVKGTKFAFEPIMVSNFGSPDLPVAARVQTMA